ncbi:hypothetical protein HDV05_000603, partial [Chytridiales sp. JEL 0842]
MNVDLTHIRDHDDFDFDDELDDEGDDDISIHLDIDEDVDDHDATLNPSSESSEHPSQHHPNHSRHHSYSNLLGPSSSAHLSPASASISDWKDSFIGLFSNTSNKRGGSSGRTGATPLKLFPVVIIVLLAAFIITWLVWIVSHVFNSAAANSPAPSNTTTVPSAVKPAQPSMNASVKNALKDFEKEFIPTKYDSLDPTALNVRYYELNITEGIRRPDCVEQKLILANGQFPGPTIRIRPPSIFKLRIYNHLPSHPLTIHLHGLLQPHTPFYDGVPYLTQAPIMPGESFVIETQVQRGMEGTYMWHSHSGALSLSGALVVEPALDVDEVGSEEKVVELMKGEKGDVDGESFAEEYVRPAKAGRTATGLEYDDDK